MTKPQSLPRTSVTETGCIPLCLTVVTGFLLAMLPFLTGCGGGSGSGDGQASTPADTGITASLTWDPIPDPSVNEYFVYYGRQSPEQPGSCAYESSMHVQADSPSAIITNLDPNTLYYFTVSAYNGQESACSAEASTVTPPTPV